MWTLIISQAHLHDDNDCRLVAFWRLTHTNLIPCRTSQESMFRVKLLFICKQCQHKGKFKIHKTKISSSVCSFLLKFSKFLFFSISFSYIFVLSFRIYTIIISCNITIINLNNKNSSFSALNEIYLHNTTHTLLQVEILTQSSY